MRSVFSSRSSPSRNRACAGGSAARPGPRGSSGAHAASAVGGIADPKIGLSGCHCGLSRLRPRLRRSVLAGP
eukprot:88574-Alexandrium_andersonii.AAC.1